MCIPSLGQALVKLSDENMNQLRLKIYNIPKIRRHFSQRLSSKAITLSLHLGFILLPKAEKAMPLFFQANKTVFTIMGYQK